jgi:hypothetical protein
MNGSDGWSMPFNPTGEPEGSGAAIFIQAYDLAGNESGASSWNLGVDKTSPTSSMNLLEPNQPSNAFLVTWLGADNLSGIDYVEIQQKPSNTDWTTFPPIDGSNSSYWVVANPGNSYSYRMHAVDHSGNSENYPPDPEATTAIPEAAVLCFAPDSYDTSGNDNTPDNASIIYINGAGQFHNFCNPLAENYQDVDWAKLIVNQDQHYIFQSKPISVQTATDISLYAEDKVTLLAEAAPRDFGDSTTLVWTADRTAQVYLRFKHVDERVIGNDVGSMIFAKSGIWTYLTRVNRK